MNNYRRFPFTLLAVSAALLSLAGCASSYRVSPDAANYGTTLTETQALADVKRFTQRGSDYAGLCSAMTNDARPVAARMLDVKDPNLELESTYQVFGQQAPARFRVNLRDLVRIRVLDEEHNPSGCPMYTPRGYMVMVDDRGIGDVSKGRTNAVIIHVTAQNLDYLIAALTRLSPNAAVMRGFGL